MFENRGTPKIKIECLCFRKSGQVKILQSKYFNMDTKVPELNVPIMEVSVL